MIKEINGLFYTTCKGNHATVHDEMRLFFEDAVAPCLDLHAYYYVTADRE